MRHRLFKLFEKLFPVMVLLAAAGCSQREGRVALLDAEPPDEVGCYRATSLRPVWFKEGNTSYLYEDEFWRASRRLLDIWERDRGYFIVEGHVDHHEADKGDGQILSKSRAKLVAKALEDMGIPQENIIPVGRADRRYDTPYDPGSRVAPINRRVQITPTHWGWTCREHMLIRYTMFLTKNCQGAGPADPDLRQRCEDTFNRLPAVHQELLRTGRTDANK